MVDPDWQVATEFSTKQLQALQVSSRELHRRLVLDKLFGTSLGFARLQKSLASFIQDKDFSL